MSQPAFVHLRIHSDFSIVDGLQKVGPLCKSVADLGMPAMALTDEMNMFGLIRYYQQARKLGIKPIIGVDLQVLYEQWPENPLRLTALAMDMAGYKSITALISKAYLRGHKFGTPCVDEDWLTELSDGVILLSGGRHGDIGQALLKNNRNALESSLAFYQTHFSDRFYLELTRTGRPREDDYIHQAVALAHQHSLPVVATNEVVFLAPDDFEAHEIRVAINNSCVLADPRRPQNYSDQQYLRSTEEMQALFTDIPEALANTVEIAKRCNVELELGTYYLPSFPTEGLETGEFLVLKSQEGLEQRLNFLFPDPVEREAKRPAYQERLDIELKVINDMGFPGYFLVVMEFIQWSKDNGIPVGPGRGSGAGSLVAYALKITDLDPLEFDLLFERFLNPERVSMPDFDVDFCMDRRDEVIEHVAELYGREAVSQIITFGTMAAKAVVRDVGRVLSHPYGFVDRISKLIPAMPPGMTLKAAFEAEPRLPQMYAEDNEVKELIDMARRLEGVNRNAGKHAGGVVIAPTKIIDFAPLYCDEEGNHPVTQFDKDDVETAGLVKFDFLGLRTLTIIQWAVDMANERLQKQGAEPIRIEHIPLNDPKCYRSLKKAETTAVFQLESRGMKELIKRQLPDNFEDIIALVALFRPGPLQSGMVDNFIDRKHGREEISYPDPKYQHECLKPILEPTYGIILYQEQVMQIAREMAGYTLGGADLLRRAMGKKKPEEMAAQRELFETGAQENGIDPELAIKIFDLVEKFAGYGFNKSHSAAYALVAYQTLWMKVHYPSEYMAAVMSADMDNTDKIVTLVDECDRMKLTILPPDVNAGQYKFTVDENLHIVYGIGAIKGVGEGPIESIIAARQEGPFTDLFDFCRRVDLKKLNRRVMERLIKAGALDKLGPHRAALMASLEKAMRQAEQAAKDDAAGQADLFGLMPAATETAECAFVQVPHWPEGVWLEGERDTLGLYLTGHPVNRYREELKHYTRGRLSEIGETGRGNHIAIAGLVLDIRSLVNKKGQRWGLVTLDDKSARLDVRFYADVFEKYETLLAKDQVVWIKGEVGFDHFSGGNTMTASEAMTLEEARAQFVKAIQVTVHLDSTDDKGKRRLSACLIEALQQAPRGTCPVQLDCYIEGASVSLLTPAQWYVEPTDDLLYQVEQLVGEGNVRLNFES